jgi:hypothetical protein
MESVYIQVHMKEKKGNKLQEYFARVAFYLSDYVSLFVH